MADTIAPIVDFLNRFNQALGIASQVEVEHAADGPRLNLTGEEAELLARHRGEPIKALQHVVDMAFGRDLPSEEVRRRFEEVRAIANRHLPVRVLPIEVWKMNDLGQPERIG